MSELSKQGAGLAALLLNEYMLLTLEKKGLLTTPEVNEIVEQTLLNLESHQLSADVEDRPIVEQARAIVETLRALLAQSAPSKPQSPSSREET